VRDEEAVPAREELRWLTRVLGDARDPHVSWERLRELLAAEPEDEVAGPVQRRLDTTYAARLASGEEQLTHALGSARHHALLEQLDRMVADPPWSPEAGQPAAEVLPGLLADDWRRLEVRRAAVADADPGEALHDVRKAAKRLRYGAETLRPAWGDDARRLGDAAQRFSDHLGQRQDLVLVRTDLVAMAELAEAAGEPSRTWGALLGRADERRRQLDLTLEEEWRRVAQPRLRQWLP
jgi:CHAD domain-containing protein